MGEKMKKLLTIGLSVMFFVINSVSLFASPHDFYGTWVGNFTEDEIIVAVKFQFNESVLTMGLNYMVDNEILDQEEFTVEIRDWKEKVNTDNNTKSVYPSGYLLEIFSPSGTTYLELYISDDKRQFTIPEFNEETNEITAFIKQ
jgi:uncharacterized protein YxeA